MRRTLVLLALAPLASIAQDSPIDRRRTPVVEAIEHARPAVVSITSELRTQFWSPFMTSEPPVAGTGVVIFEDGYIITNNHVIDRAQNIHVSFDEADDKRAYEARVISRVPDEDLALLKIDGETRPDGTTRPFPTVPLSESDPILGETVIAIGNAFGHTHTVSTGIVSGLHRDIVTREGLRFTNLIQTDASINPGNSGGPLLDINGEMIGINSAMQGMAQNIGFAIPVARVKRVLSEHLLSLDQASFWLGFELDERGLEVSNVVAGGPADEAGLQEGDRLVGLNGRKFEKGEDYRRALLSVKPRDEVTLEIARGVRSKSLRLATWNRIDGIIYERLGLTLEVIRFGRNYQPLLRVVSVQPGSPASGLELQPGDVIAAVQPAGWRAKKPQSLPDLAWVLSSLKPGTQIVIEVFRDDDKDGILERDLEVSELYRGTLKIR